MEEIKKKTVSVSVEGLDKLSELSREVTKKAEELQEAINQLNECEISIRINKKTPTGNQSIGGVDFLKD